MASHTIRTLFDITYRTDIDNVIRDLNADDYAYIFHDKDINIDGSPKKPHFHIWARWGSPVRNMSIAKILQRNNHLCITAKSQKACIRYMTHETNDAIKMGKHKYERSDIVTNLEQDELMRIFLVTEITLDKVNNIIELLDAYSLDPDREFSSFINDLMRLNCLDVYTKYYNSVFSRLIKSIFR